MSNTIDQRTVEMVFDNKQFEKGVAETIRSLESLDKSLDSVDSGSFSDTVNNMAKSASGLDQVADQIENSKSKVAGALESFTSLFSGFVIDIGDIGKTVWGAMNSMFNFQGGMNRALNIENAKFQLEGLGVAWKDVSDDINYAVTDTAYGFDSAAKAAAQFSASQVALGTDMKAALRGISGVAAMTNSSYDEIANIFTRIAGQGKVMAMDLNSLAARGLNAAATLGEAMHISESEVRDLVSSGQIGFQEFANYMDEAFGLHATKANETFSGALSNMNAAWSRFWALFLGGSDKDEEGNIYGTGGGILNMLRRVFLSIKQVVSDLGKVFTPIADLLQPVTDGVGTMAEKMANFISDLWTETVETGEIAEDGTKKTTKVVAKLGNEAFAIFENIGDAVTSFARPFMAFFDALLPSFDEFYHFAWLIRDVNFTDRFQLAEGAVRILETAFSALGTVLHNVLGAILLAANVIVDKLVMAFIVAKDALDTFFDALWEFSSTAFDAFTSAIGEIQNPLDSFWEAINNSKFSDSSLFKFLEKAGTLFSEFWGIMDEAASTSTRMPWDQLAAKFGEIIEHFLGILDETGNNEFAKNLKENYIKPLSNFIDGIKNLFTSEGVTLVFSNLGTIAGDIARGFASAAGIIFGVLGDITGGILNTFGFVFDILVSIKDNIAGLAMTAISSFADLGASVFSGFLEVFGIKFAYAADSAEANSETVGKSVSDMAKAFEESPVGTTIDRIGEAFENFGAILSNGIPSLQDWTNFFGGVGDAIGDFVKWLDPIGRIQTAIATIKEAFTNFGTNEFVGWGTKFIGDNSSIAGVLDAISNAFSGFWQAVVENLPTGETVSQIFENIGNAIIWLMDTFEPLFEGIGRIVGTLGADFIGFLGQLVDSLSNMQGFDLSVIGESLHNIFSDFNEFTKAFAEGNFNVFDILGDALGSLTGLFDPFIKMFLPETAYAAELAGDTVEALSGAELGEAGENISSGGNILTDAVGTISNKMSDAASVFGDGSKALTDAFRWVGDNLPLVAGVLAGGAMYISVMKSLKSFRKMAEGISGVASSASGLLKGLQEKFGLISKPLSKIEQLRELVLAIVKLVAAVAIVSLLPPERIWPAVGVVAALGAVIVALIAAMALINKKFAPASGINYMGMAAEISAMATAVLIASASLFIISMIPQDRLLSSFLILEAILAGFAGIGFVLGKFGGKSFLAGAAALLILGAALLEFAAIIVVFTIIPWGLLTTGITAVVIMLAALITTAGLLHKFAPDLLVSAAGLLAISLALYAVTGALILLDEFGGDNIIRNTIILVSSLAALVTALLVLDKLSSTAPRMLKLATALVVVSSALAIIAMSISMLSLLTNVKEATSSAIMLGVLFAELAVALGVLAKMNQTEAAARRLLVVASTLVIASAAMGIIGAAISAMVYMASGSDELLAASLGLTIAFAAMSVALGLLTEALTSGVMNPVMLVVAAGGILAMAAAMYILAEALNKMANVDWTSVGQLLVIMTVFFGLGAIAGLLGPVALGILAFGAALLMAGGGMLAFANGLTILNEAIPGFADAIDQFLTKMIDTMSEKFPVAVDVFMDNLQLIVDRSGEIMLSVSEIVVSVISGMCDAIVESAPKMAESLLGMMERSIEWMTANSDRLHDALLGFANVLGGMLGTAIEAIPVMLSSFIDTIVTDIGNMMHDSAQNMANETVDSYIDAYKDAARKMSKQELADALLGMNPEKLKVQGSVSFAGGDSAFSFDTENAKQMAAILDQIYNDPDVYNYINNMEGVNGTLDEIAISYQEAMGLGDKWVKSTEEVTAATEDLDGSVEDLVVDYGNITENLNPVWDMLKDNELFSKLNLDGQEFADLLNTIGDGSIINGLNMALGDTSALSEGLVTILGEDAVAALEAQGITIDDLQASLANATGEAEMYGVTLSESGEQAYYTLQDISAALANGVDVSAALASMETLREGIYQLRDAFDAVNITGVATFNNMVIQISAAIAQANAKMDTLGTHAVTAMSNVTSAISSAGTYAYNNAWYVGKYAVDGFVAGINQYLGNATAAGREIARRAKEAELDVKSPSKVFFEIGKFVAMGFGNGIHQYTDYAENMAAAMGRTSIETMRSSLADISYMVEGIDWDSQPTIRPVLDTSNVEAGWAYINGLMGRSPMMQAAYAGPRSGRVISSNSSRINNISIDLHYQAGTDAGRMVNDIANGLAMKLNLEA